MHQPVIGARYALALIVALWGFVGWLDRPLEDEQPEGMPAPAEAPSMHLRCVSASMDASSDQRALRPLLVSFAPDSPVAADFDLSDAALLRCRIVN